MAEEQPAHGGDDDGDESSAADAGLELAAAVAVDDELPDEMAAELAAVAEAEADELPALRLELQELRDALEAERGAHRAAVARYREAVLVAAPALPPELVSGDDLAAVDASVEAARRAVAQIRERLVEAAEEGGALGFPPARRSGAARAPRR